jgi:GNAT superfamily N-acetyltransferase
MASPTGPLAALAETLGEYADLRDGRRVHLRPIRPDDADLLVEANERLSPASRYFRWFTSRPHLSSETAGYLAEVDFRSRFAIVATVTEDGVERIVAVARFDLAPDEAVAEFALTVLDDYQSAGLGTLLWYRLVELARARGVRRLTAVVLADNQRMKDLLRKQGVSAGVVESGVVEFGISLDDPPSVLSVLGILARNRSSDEVQISSA